MKRLINYLIFSVVLTLTSLAQAGIIVEKEPTTLAQPQRIEIPEEKTATIEAVLGVSEGTPIPDVDYFLFCGKEGDVVDIDIDGAYKPGLSTTTAGSFDSNIALYTDGYVQLQVSKDWTPVDEGSAAMPWAPNRTPDSYIPQYRLPATACYVVGVSSQARPFNPDGTVPDGSNKNGAYKLIISGVTPSSIRINIEIKPGSTEYVPLNPKANGKVPVALLSNSNFDAPTLVDRTTLTFGRTGGENSLSKSGKKQTPQCGADDVNGDGRLDLVCHFENQDAGFEQGDVEGILRGRTNDGRAFEGRAPLKVLQEKSDD